MSSAGKLASGLPIEAVLPDLCAALRSCNSAVLIAPPGAGKTTAVALSLLEESWCVGQIILLSPRRVAARAAAERMAQQLEEEVGARVGYRTRLDSRTSASTRILVVTEAIFVSQIIADQELAGVSAVLFDEAHERHLDSDLALALALESQSVLREDLRLVVMSATIEGEAFSRLFGKETPIIESEGRTFPLQVEWLGSRPEQRLEDQMASAVLTAWRDQQGDVLAFLPGMREIERVRERLEARLPDTPILPLHGQVAPEQQRAAIRQDPTCRRRIVLATSIAETSLTLEGVSVVVDSGLSRRAEFEVAAGLTHLVTRPSSQASATQRAGRAARTTAGVAYRLWEEAAHAGRPAYDPPEMLNADLAPLTLALAQWGVHDPTSLRWLDPPPAPALAAARDRLQALGALDEEGRITKRGRAIAALPMAPWQAAILLFGAQHDAAIQAAQLAMLLQERGLGGRADDLENRLLRWRGDRSSRAQASRKLAERWAKSASGRVSEAASERVGKARMTRDQQAKGDAGVQGVQQTSPPLGILLASALPDNLARRRDSSGESWLSAGGRGYSLDPTSPLAGSEWLAIGDAQGSAKGARITAALPVSQAEIVSWLTPRIERHRIVRWIAESETAEPVIERRIGAILLSRAFDSSAEQGEVSRILLNHFVSKGLAALPLSPASIALLERARHAGVEALTEQALKDAAEDWLGSILGDLRSLRDLDPAMLHQALLHRLDYQQRQMLDRAAPAQFTSPAGTHHAIDYADPAGPSVEVRVQALFGLDSHPPVGDAPLLLKLTSPAGRPIQATRDLPGFWRGSWEDVRKDMKGRYPKHRWPEEPWGEVPSLKTRNAFERS